MVAGMYPPDEAPQGRNLLRKVAMVYVTPISGSGKWEARWYGFVVWYPNGLGRYEVIHQSSCTYRTSDEALKSAMEWCETNGVEDPVVSRNPECWGKS